MPDKSRLDILTASVLSQIEDRFTDEGAEGLVYTSPFDHALQFQIFNENPDGSWDLLVNGKTRPNYESLPSLTAAKTLVAERIAVDMCNAEEILTVARMEGLMPA